MPSDIRYHKSTEDLETEERADEPKLRVDVRRFSALERVLLVALCAFIVLALLFIVLYAISKSSNGSIVSPYISTGNNSVCMTGNNSVCMTAKCVLTSSDILRSLDWSFHPCEDFYNFSCNKWLTSTHIPASSSKINQFSKLCERNNEFILAKLEDKEYLKKYQDNEAVVKAITDYQACMAAKFVKESGKMKRERDFIVEYGGWNISGSTWNHSGWELMENLVKLNRDLDVWPLFSIYISEDSRDSTRYLMTIVIRRSFLRPKAYVENTTSYARARTLYRDLMLGVLTLLGNTSKNNADIQRQVGDIFEFERRLAEESVRSIAASQLKKSGNYMTVKQLQELTGNTFNWLEYFQELFKDTKVEITNNTELNVMYPQYLRNLILILIETDKTLLANYMTWMMISTLHAFLNQAVQREFNEYSRMSFGFKKNAARRKKCLSYTNTALGLPLSKLYLDEKFGENDLENIEEMVADIRDVYIENLKNNPWMDSETKKMALLKATTIKKNVGYPKIIMDKEKLRQKFLKLEIRKDDFFGNQIRKQKFRLERQLEKLGRPVDKGIWHLYPTSCNAYYKASANIIVFPAGVLQSPFFDISRPMSLNFGSIGSVIGHELTHSFDDTGRLYDENGNLANWWKNSSVIEFKNRSKCFIEKYSKYKYKGFPVDGKRTLGENIADNGGIDQSFKAYQKWSKMHDSEPTLPALNVTKEQLFFIGFAQTWCAKQRPSLYRFATLGKHSPTTTRVLGTLSNYPGFSKAFNCPAGSTMNPRKKCFVY